VAEFNRQRRALRVPLGTGGKLADDKTTEAGVAREVKAGRMKAPPAGSVIFLMDGPAEAFNWGTATASTEIVRAHMVLEPYLNGPALGLPNVRPAGGGL
jgi:hypothetical protein